MGGRWKKSISPTRGFFHWLLWLPIWSLLYFIACNLPEMNHIVESVSYFMNPWSELKTNLEVLILLKSVCRALVSWRMNFVLKTELGAAKNATIITILRVAKNCGLLNWLKMSYKVIHTSRSVFLNADPKRMVCDCWLWPIVTALSDGKIFFALYGNHNLIGWRNYNYQSECLVYNICSYVIFL